MSMPTRGTIEDRENEAFEEIAGRIYKAAVVFPPGGGTVFDVTLTEPDDEVVTNVFGEALAVPIATETTVVTYTVGIGFNFFMQFVECDGTNISEYRVYKDAVAIAKKRTWWTGLNTKIDFIDSKMRGLKFIAGETITLKVEHARVAAGDYNGRIIGVLVPA